MTLVEIPDEDMYCTSQDIIDYLGIPMTVSDDSDPSDSFLKMFIKQAMAEMERKTNRAWRTKRHDKLVRDITASWDYTRGVPIYLAHTDVRPITSSDGDKIEAWVGTRYQDVTENVTLTELPSFGKIWIRGYVWSWLRTDRLRITYRYGSALTYDVQEVCMKLAGIKLIERSFTLKTLAFGGNIDPTNIVETWKRDVDEFYRDIQEWVVLES